jgi:iron complex transport system permease protein
LFICFALLALLVAPWLGVRTLTPSDVFGRASDASGLDARIFWQLRLPRELLAWCAGATFGICGMVFQALFRNPLAEPSLLGVSSGASLGAAAAIRFGLVAGTGAAGLLGAVTLPACAFVGALGAVGIITAFARMTRSTKDATLLLAGVAISSLFSSVIMIFQYTSGAVETFRLVSWTMGGINAIGMNEGLRAIPPMLLALILAACCATELDLITFGDEIASTRGVALERLKRVLFVGMSLSVAVVVANCGPIGFLGLIAPHIARRLVGPRHFALTFATAVVGGTALLVCDTAARTLWAPADLPVGVIISFLGAPFFLWLLFGPRRAQ